MSNICASSHLEKENRCSKIVLQPRKLDEKGNKMEEDELEIINMIRNSKDQQKALDIAIKVILDFLASSQWQQEQTAAVP